MAFLLVLTEDPSSGLYSISLDRVLLTAPEGPVPQTPRREVQLLRHGAAGAHRGRDAAHLRAPARHPRAEAPLASRSCSAAGERRLPKSISRCRVSFNRLLVRKLQFEFEAKGSQSVYSTGGIFQYIGASLRLRPFA